MGDKTLSATLSQTFLFNGVSQSVIEEIVTRLGIELCDFDKGDTIYTPSTFQKRVGFVLQGECEVRRCEDADSAISINVIKKHGSFGILAAIRAEEEFPTVVLATKKCRIAFISGEDILSLAKAYPDIAVNIISFLAGRVAFLNARVRAFSGNTVEKKLASYILTSYKERGSLSIDLNKSKTAQAISAGRASLYRALTSLAEQEVIRLDEKSILIIDLEGLERISK